MPDFSDSDDDTDVFEVINTEKARQEIIVKLKEEKLKKTNGESTISGETVSGNKKPAVVSKTARNKVVVKKEVDEIEVEPEAVVTNLASVNGRRGSSNSKVSSPPSSNETIVSKNVNTAVNGGGGSRKITLKRFSNGSNSDDEIDDGGQQLRVKFFLNKLISSSLLSKVH